MTKTTNPQIANKKMLPPGVIVGVAMIVSITINGVPTAAALEQIHSSREVSASVDRLWKAIANLGNDTAWNQVDSMKIIKKTGNMIEADTTVGPQALNLKSHEIIMLHPKQSVVTNVTQGPITGSRVVTLIPLSENKTKIDVLWSIDMPVENNISTSFFADFITFQAYFIPSLGLGIISISADSRPSSIALILS